MNKIPFGPNYEEMLYPEKMELALEEERLKLGEKMS